MNISFEWYLARSYANKASYCMKRGMEFALTLDDWRELMTTEYCAYTGVKMTTKPYSYKGGVDQAVPPRDTDRSIERVDSKKPYTKENTVAVCNLCNNKKSLFETSPDKMQQFDFDTFVENCKKELENA